MSPVQPVASPLSNIHVPTVFSAPGVQLAATFDPFTPWVDVITNAVTNVGVLGTAWLADPLPVGRQALTNWIGYTDTTATALGGVATAAFNYLTTTLPQDLKTIFQQLADGQPSAAAATLSATIVGAVVTLGLPMFPVVAIPGQITDNLTAAVHAVTDISTLFNLLIGALAPVSGGILAAGDTAQEFVDSAGAGDYAAAAQAIFDFAPNVVGAIINGYTAPDNTFTPGLLTPPDEFGFNAGLAYTLLVTIPKAIADAITPPVPPAAARSILSAASVEAAPTETTDVTEPADQGGTQGSSSEPTDSAGSTDATDGKSGSSSATAGVGGARPAGKAGTAKTATAAKKPTGATTSTGAKSARPHSGSGHDRSGSAAE